MSGDLLPVSLDEMISEMKRELNLRRYVYPVRIADRKLNARRADRQIMIVEAIIAKFESERDATGCHGVNPQPAP